MVRLWVCLLAAGIGLAQAPGESNAKGGFWRDVGRDQAALVTAPLKLKKKQWLTTVLPIAGATAALVLVDSRVARGLPNTTDQTNVSKAVSQAGAVYTLGAGVLGTALVARASGKPGTARTSVLAGRSLISATALTFAMKFAAGRERPFQNTDGRFLKAKDSFPSGHSMAIWAVASTVARRRGCPKWLAGISYAAAIAVGLSRVGAQKHFPGDVFAGSSLGYLIGARMARQP